jgi:hypothetical protein
MPGTPPRSLADDLRARTDAQLAALIQARPDLIHPVPADLAALAQRAGSPPSVATALRGYDTLTLHVVLAAALLADPVSPAALVRDVLDRMPAGLPASAARERLRGIVGRLRTDALLWGGDRALHLVGAARDLVIPPDRGPRVAALDPAVAAFARDPQALRDLVADAPPGARQALDRLLAGPVIGTVVHARRTPDPDRSPIDWMLAHHLLVPVGDDRAALPAEVVAVLRDAPSADPARRIAVLVPPVPAGPPPDRKRTDAGGVGAMLDLLHAVGELGPTWADSPPNRLRAGGIAMRDVARTARSLGCSEPVAALAIGVAAAAGLLATDSREILTVLPTPAFDTWVAEPPAPRVAALLRAWRDMPQGVAGPGQRPLDPELAFPALPALRRDVLAALASADGAWTDAEVLEALAWAAPRRDDPGRAERALAVLEELRMLGLLVGGALSRVGHALLADDASGALEAALQAVLPAQVDHLVLQADLTAIVPGLPTPGLAALLRLAADPESTGVASVYRFSPATVRRALDAGRGAADLLADLSRRGTVPQPLAYLVEDVGRRHAVLRIGATSTYLRCDDPVLLAALLADPAAASLGLFPLSDTVLGSDLPPEHVLERLRALGHSPQPDAGRGPETPQPRRARARPAPTEAPTSTVTPALAAAAVRALRANDRGPSEGRGAAGPDSDRAVGRRPGQGAGRGAAPSGAAKDGPVRAPVHPVPVTSPAEVVAALRAAIATESTVWIGYADPAGVAGDRRVEPLRLTGGYLTALDLRSESLQSFALARITGVQPA